MRILVTGGAGYVGSTLVPILLAQGHQVRVFDSLLHGGESLLAPWASPGFEFVRGDVRDPDLVGAALDGCGAVVHLAAIVGDPACARQPAVARAVNLDATRCLVEEACRRHVGRFVFASTCSNYGRMKDAEGYVDEATELRPVSLYAETKVSSELHLISPDTARRIRSTCLRFATVYGVAPRMRFDLTVNEFTMEMMTKQALVVFGEQFWRPYVHVRDAARAIATVLEAPESAVAGEVFNVGATPENYRKQDLVELIRPYAPDAKVEFVQRTEDPRDYRVSFEKIGKALGYGVQRTVPHGIAEVAQLVRSGAIQNFENPRYRN